MRNGPQWLMRIVPALVASVALAAPDDRGQAEVALSKQATLSPSEMVDQAREYQSKMQSALKRVQNLEEQAQKQKDVIRLNCVRDKREKIKGYLTVADKSLNALNEAARKNDAGERQHEYTRMTILSQQVEVLGTEAQNCTGTDIPVPGTTGVTLEIDKSIPETDPTVWPVPGLEPTPRPFEASPQI